MAASCKWQFRQDVQQLSQLLSTWKPALAQDESAAGGLDLHARKLLILLHQFHNNQRSRDELLQYLSQLARPGHDAASVHAFADQLLTWFAARPNPDKRGE